MRNDAIIEIVRLAIGSIHDHAKWAGEEIARAHCEINKLEQDIDYLKGQVESLKTENAALRKKVEKHKEES